MKIKVSTEPAPGFHQATQRELIEAFRGAFNDVRDKDVFETAVLPLVALMALNANLHGNKDYDGPACLKYCLDNPDNEGCKAMLKLSMVFLCKFSELALLELTRNKIKAGDPSKN